MWLTLYFTTLVAVAYGQSPYIYDTGVSFNPHSTRRGYSPSYGGDGPSYLAQPTGNYHQDVNALPAGGYQASYQPRDGRQYYGEPDEYQVQEHLFQGRPEDKEVCGENGQYLSHPEDPCMYMLCVYTMYGWVHEPMPCPPGTGAPMPEESLPPNTYPCVAIRHTCRRKIIGDEPSEKEEEEKDEKESDKESNLASYVAPFVGADEPVGYENSQEQEPRRRQSRIQDIIHGIDDQDRQQFVLQVPHEGYKVPSILDSELSRGSGSVNFQQQPQQSARDDAYPEPPPPPSRTLAQPDYQHQPPPRRQRPSYREQDYRADNDEPQRIHRVMTVRKPGMKMVVEETEQMSNKNRPGYKMSKQRKERTNMTKHRGDGNNGDLVMKRTSEYSEFSQTHTSNFGVDNAGRPHRQPRQPYSDFPVNDPQPGGYDTNALPLPPLAQVARSPAYNRLPRKASFVHMPVIPSSLEEFFQNSFESLR